MICAGGMAQLLLPKAIKDAATAAFKHNPRLADLSWEERELSALAYESIAQRTVGRKAELARLYNLERARFLRGEVDHIAPTADLFGQEIGFVEPE